MAINFTLPELGENVDSGTVTAVLVKKGEEVKKDQTVVQLETDKAVVDIPSPQGGVVSEVQAKVGQTLKVGDLILVLDGKGGEEPKKETAAEKPKPEAKEPEQPKKDAAEDKPKPEAKEPEPPKKEEAEAAEPASAKIEPETPPAKIEEEPTTLEEIIPPAAPEPREQPVSAQPLTVRAAPSVRRLAREIGIDIAAVPAAIAGAAFTAEDVKAYARSLQGRGPAAETVIPKRTTDGVNLPNFEKWGPVTREKMSTIRRLTAEGMARSWSAVPHVTQHDKADITDLEKFRKQYGKSAERAGGKLTVTAILVRVIAEALKKFPQFNASIDTANSEIVYKQFYNVGVAVDTEWGLLVPSIKNADRKSLIDIAAELSDMSARARERKTTLEELQGSCITITNLGGIGGTSFTPIVNLPEVAILGVSRAQVEPVHIDGEFVARTMMPLSLSYDHRVIDGAAAARFARWICEALEQPFSMFLE